MAWGGYTVQGCVRYVVRLTRANEGCRPYLRDQGLWLLVRYLWWERGKIPKRQTLWREDTWCIFSVIYARKKLPLTEKTNTTTEQTPHTRSKIILLWIIKSSLITLSLLHTPVTRQPQCHKTSWETLGAGMTMWIKHAEEWPSPREIMWPVTEKDISKATNLRTDIITKQQRTLRKENPKTQI